MVGHRNHGLLVALFAAGVVVVVVLMMKCEATRKSAWDVVPPGCMNCTICPYLCHPSATPPPPAIPDYPVGGVPPPPPPSTLPYPSDIVPPPPPPPPSNCTTVPVQCCYNTPPMGYGSYQPQPFTPPSGSGGYGYQPVGNYSPTPHFISLMPALFLLSIFYFLL